MTGPASVAAWPCGTPRSQNNVFGSVPPKAKPNSKTPPPKRGRPTLTKAQQAAISLETPEERQARQTAQATAFVHFAGICDFGVKPDHMSIETKKAKLTGKGRTLAIDR